MNKEELKNKMIKLGYNVEELNEEEFDYLLDCNDLEAIGDNLEMFSNIYLKIYVKLMPINIIDEKLNSGIDTKVLYEFLENLLK